MLSKLLTAGLNNRGWVLALFGLVIVVGVDAAFRLPIDAVPDVTNVQVIVNVKTGALDPGKIERLVTYPVETELAGLPGVDEVRSLSKYGLAQITVVFQDRTNVYFARQLVAERLQGVRANLPAGVSPELAPVTTALGEVLMYLVDPKPGSPLAALPEKERLLYLKEVQDYVLRPALKKVPGIAEVDGNGGLSRQVHINVSPERLERFGLSLERFVAKIDTLGESFGGGYIQRDGTQLIVRATGGVTELNTIAEIPLGLNVRGTPILIRDVAEVRADHALRVGAATHGGHETVLGTVLMRSGANSREVAAAAERALVGEIHVPDDVKLSVVYSRSHLVNATIRTISRSLVEGAVLVTLLLLLLLGNVRAALLVAGAIPVSMLFALKGMQLFGVSANLMSLGAIDFGLLVDGSVVLIENVVTRFAKAGRRPRSAAERLDLVRAASEEVLGPLVFGLAIIMVVYVPILFLEGVEGKMFEPMALTILMALAGSLLVAVFLMPVLAYTLLPLGQDHGEPAVSRWLRERFRPLLNACRARAWVVPALVGVPAVLAALLFLRLGSDFVPQLDEGDLVINITRDSRQDIDTSVARQIEDERVIAQFGEVETVFSRLGTSDAGLDPMSPAFADTFVILKKDLSQWPLVEGRRRTKAELFEAIKARVLATSPAQDLAATQPIEMRFNEVLEGSRADVSLRLLGPDLDRLLGYTQQAQKLLGGLAGVSSLESDPLTALTKSPVLDVVLNYGHMARFGVSLRDVNEVVETAMSGREVGSFYQEDRRFPVLVHLDEGLRNDIASVARIPVGLADGGTVRLAAVTDIVQHDQVTTVARTGARRYSALSIFLKGRDLGGFVAEAQRTLASAFKLAPGYEMTWGGQFKNLRRARERLMIIVPLTLLVIFLLLLRGFGNLRHAALVFLAIPFAMMGGVFALWLRGISFSVSAAIGFIALAGIATLNSMVLVTFFNQSRAAGLALAEAVTTGAAQRLRPVLTTALVASLGFVPMALNTGTGAEVQRPLATVVIGGVITSTLLTLIVVPVVYEWIESWRARRHQSLTKG